jgi:selenide,water dikinase
LDAALKNLPRQNLPGILVGYENSDDAGVFLLTPELAIVQTVDFFSPIVDDPFTFGQIAAANSLSDIYAMGGEPRTALSVVAFPTKGIEPSVLGEIMKGGLDKLNEAGVSLLGGHTVRDDEIKFGYAVTGVVSVSNIKQNNNGRAGDRLILTKPLGTGLIATAIKRGKASSEYVTKAIEVMSELNRKASSICVQLKVDTMTDITGFGLVGHALEVCKASHIGVQIDHRRLPVLPGALEYSRAGFCAGGLGSNREFFSQNVHFSDAVPPEFHDLVFDPQTSGGLLIFSNPTDTPQLIQALQQSGIAAAEIGHAREIGGDSLIDIV